MLNILSRKFVARYCASSVSEDRNRAKCKQPSSVSAFVRQQWVYVAILGACTQFTAVFNCLSYLLNCWENLFWIARLVDAIAGMQINSINFRLHDLLEQLCRCFDLSTTIWAFMKFQVFNDSYPEPRFRIRSCLRTFKTNLQSLNVQTCRTKTFFPRFFRFEIEFDIWLVFEIWSASQVAESQASENRYQSKTSCLRKKLTAETCRRDSCGNRFDSRVRWLNEMFHLWRFLVKKKLQDHLPMTKRAVGKRCDIMQMIKTYKTLVKSFELWASRCQTWSHDAGKERLGNISTKTIGD